VNQVESRDKNVRIAGVVENSIVDGPGIRFTIFAQGCPLKCPDCHNPETHDSLGGELVDISELVKQIVKDPLLDGVTFSGGEPFYQSDAFLEIAHKLRASPDFKGNVICYTGYTYDELCVEPNYCGLLEQIDILIDGRFESTLKQLERKNRRFRGSTNQRAIDVKESLRIGKTVEIDL